MRQIRNSTLILSIFCLLGFHGWSQSSSLNPFYFVNLSDRPVADKNMPAWAAFFYEKKPVVNVRVTDSLIGNWMREMESANAPKLAGNPDSENWDERENKWVTFYNEWRQTLPLEWIDSDGNVKPPDITEYKRQEERQEQTWKYYKEMNQRSAGNAPVTGGSSSSWSLFGPLRTYSSEGESQSLLQVPRQANVYFLDIAPSDSKVQIASTEMKAMFKTTDKGLNWNYIGDYRGPVAFHPGNANYVIMGSKPFRYSTNGGTSWTNAATGGANTNDIFLTADGQFAVAATDDGLWVSNDGGVNWTQKYKGIFYDVQKRPGSNVKAYAISESGVFYSTSDAGATWTTITPAYSMASTKGYLLSVTPSNPNMVFIAAMQTVSGGDQCQILKSTDGGQTFSTAGTMPAQFSNGFYDFAFQVSVTDPNIMFCGITSLWKTKDGGLNWTPIGGAYYPLLFPVHADIQDIAVADNEVFVATDGGISLSTDNFSTMSNWSNRTNGIFASEFWGFAQGFQQDIVGGGRYHNGNTAWREPLVKGEFGFIVGGESPAGVHILAYPTSIAYRDFKAGEFVEIPTSLNNFYNPYIDAFVTPRPGTFKGHPNQNYYGERIADVAWHPVYASTIYSSSDSTLIVSTDRGQNFMPMRKFNSMVWGIKTCRSAPNYLYVLTASSGLWRSTDGGITWNELNMVFNGVSYRNDGYSIFFDVVETNVNIVFLANSKYPGNIFKSLDGGITWQSQSTPAINDVIISGLVHQAGTVDGVYLFGSRNDVSVCYYRNALHSDWQFFANGNTNGLDFSKKWLKIGMAYMKGKIRAVKRGIFESDFFENYTGPIAQPSVIGAKACKGIAVQFLDNSILKNSGGANWLWEFSPNNVTYLNGTNNSTQNPVVKFNEVGDYSVKLTVHDQDGRIDSKTIANMVKVIDDVNVPSMLNITSVNAGQVNEFIARNIVLSADVPAGTTVNLIGERIQVMPGHLTAGKINACYAKVNSCEY